MTLKIFTACLGTETHTGGPLPTDTHAFEQTYLVREGKHPDAINMFGVPLVIWRDRAQARGWQVIESLCTFATPSGLVVKKTHERFRDEILNDLRVAMPVDGVMLSLHGAMVADGYDDCEGDLVHQVRQIVGPDVPIGVEFDLHCHISRQFIEDVTALVIFKEYPHTDFAARAEELWQIIEAKLDGSVEPHMAVHDCRMVGVYHTTREPMRSFVDRMTALEQTGGVLSISLGHGFPWADIEDVGSRMVVITNNQPELGQELAEKLSRELWDMRADITPQFLEMEEAIAEAVAYGEGPVVLADMSDNPGGGAPGDSTFIIASLIKQGVRDVAVGGIWDPVAALICIGAGEGAEFDLRLGGKTGPSSGTPLDLRVRVGKIRKDFNVEALGGSKRYMGDSVSVHADGVDFVIHSARCQNTHPAFFVEFGIDISEKKILVVKSMQHFYGNYAPVSAKIIYTASAGCLIWDFTKFPYNKIARPVWPLDADPWASNVERPW
jgi:microcystin degradation protein MlrC